MQEVYFSTATSHHPERQEQGLYVSEANISYPKPSYLTSGGSSSRQSAHTTKTGHHHPSLHTVPGRKSTTTRPSALSTNPNAENFDLASVLGGDQGSIDSTSPLNPLEDNIWID